MELTLHAPLGVDWTPQHLFLALPGVEPGLPLDLEIDGIPAPFQYTGARRRDGAEICVKLGFGKEETHGLSFAPAASCGTDLARRQLWEGDGRDAPPAEIGAAGRTLLVSPGAPFGGFAGHAMRCVVDAPRPLARASLAQTCDGPLFTDYTLALRYGEDGRYTVDYRCFKSEPYVEIRETFSLGPGAEMRWTLNPGKRFTHILSRDSFEGETQPTVEPLGEEHPRDVLCRLQMPVLSEYFIPNNRGWFAFFDQRNPAAGMVGILGLHGARWEEPVAAMPELFDAGKTVLWRASLASGRRCWLLYAGPLETSYRIPDADKPGGGPEPRFVFHRLHAEFNALRLDGHLDLDGSACYDASAANAPAFFGPGDFHADARRRVQALECLRRMGEPPSPAFAYLLQPSDDAARLLRDDIASRFARWVRQFQGYRTGENDYAKNVIGFSRRLRGLLLSYELLRRDGALSDSDVRRFNACFVFAARRILDEGRWPHSRSWKHPDHPESTRDFYAYGGEHKPDRLVWTNSLPNFQSDPMAALAHLAALFPDHPDARHWLRFALEDIDRQLDAYCGNSGAWEESINYTLYTLSYLVITFRALKGRTGRDFFHDPRMRRLIGWLCRFFGPFDKRFGVATWPAIGNAVLPQIQAEPLLAFAGELAGDDPLRRDCIALWQRVAGHVRPAEHAPLLLAAMAPDVPGEPLPLAPLASEVMDEVGVSMRDGFGTPRESFLFQKIGFAKDHYEDDESAFNWYAKGTPFCMDYGTYTGDVAVGAAHNLVEIAEGDPLRRGYLADHFFSPHVDYTRCEIPVTLKLLWGRIRPFEEIDAAHVSTPRERTPYFYIGDRNPVGPKCWKVRMLLFVKPDYVVLFDRVFGRVPHRWNLHFTGGPIERKGNLLASRGRFDLDLLACVRHPAEFSLETGELVPRVHPGCGGEEARRRHAQHFVRIANKEDGLYRALLFAKERDRDVRIEPAGETGFRVTTPDYADLVFLNDDYVEEQVGNVVFRGRAGWLRRHRDGRIESQAPSGSFPEPMRSSSRP